MPRRRAISSPSPSWRVAPGHARPRRAVQHGLAVEADGGDLRGAMPASARKVLTADDCARVNASSASRKIAGSGSLEFPFAGGSDGLCQKRRYLGRVRGELPGAEVPDLFAIGADEREIDIAVEHGARHQSHGENRLHWTVMTTVGSIVFSIFHDDCYALSMRPMAKSESRPIISERSLYALVRKSRSQPSSACSTRSR